MWFSYKSKCIPRCCVQAVATWFLSLYVTDQNKPVKKMPVRIKGGKPFFSNYISLNGLELSPKSDSA